MMDTNKTTISAQNTHQGIFLYSGPHPLHREWGDSLGLRPLRFSPAPGPMPIEQAFSLLRVPAVRKARVIVLEGADCLAPAAIGKQPGSAVIMINSDTFFYRFPSLGKKRQQLLLRMLSKVDLIVSTSPYMKQLAERVIGTPNIVATPYVNHEKFSSVEPHGKDIGYIGRLDRHKGIDVLIAATALLGERKLRLIGWADNDVRESIHTAGKQVLVTGITPHPEKYLGLCGHYVNCARHEPFGINILEAMAAGFAPIVSSRCGASWIVKQVSPKLVLGEGEPNAKTVAAAVRWLDEHPIEHQDWKAACKKLSATFTKERSMKEFADAARTVVGETLKKQG